MLNLNILVYLTFIKLDFKQIKSTNLNKDNFFISSCISMGCKVVLILHGGYTASLPFASHGQQLPSSSLFHPFQHQTRSCRAIGPFELGFSLEFLHSLASFSYCTTWLISSMQIAVSSTHGKIMCCVRPLVDVLFLRDGQVLAYERSSQLLPVFYS